MAQVSVGLAAPDTAAAPRTSGQLAPASLRLLLIAAAAVSAGLAWSVTRNDIGTNADAELTRILQFMALTKGLIGAGALWMVSMQFRYPIAPRLAFGYIAGAAVMASGPGAMWSTAHIILGSLLFYSGIGLLVALGWIDGRGAWKLGGRIS